MRRKLYRADFAEFIGVETDTLNRYRLPEPDGVDIELGHARPWWWESTVEDWQKRRPGRGGRWESA